MNSTATTEMRKRVKKLRALPASPAVLQPLLKLMSQPADDIPMDRVVQLVSSEKTIVAQLLRMANSPLYARSAPVESIQGAILSQGIQRVEDVVLGHCLGTLVSKEKWVVDPSVFWRHSFGCALVCREFARLVGYRDVEQAYLAGLLHDLGIVVNTLAYNEEFHAALTAAVESGRPLYEQELETLGFTHSESGAVLAATWQLPEPIAQVIEWHHDIEHAPAGNSLIPLVHLADLLCRVRGLGYGYEEWRVIDLTADLAWVQLAAQLPKVAEMDLAKFTLDLDAYADGVTTLVDSIFSVA